MKFNEIRCWDGYKKQGTKKGTGKNKGKRVNNCVKEVTIDNKNGRGAVPDNQEVDYFGKRVMMKPSTFIKLASKLGQDPNPEMIDYIKKGGAIGAPFLVISVPWDDDEKHVKLMVSGHEGRNRMLAIMKAEGDAPVETHLFFSGKYNRARHLEPEFLTAIQSELISQDNQLVKGPLWEDGRIVKGVNTTPDVGVTQTKIEAAKFGNTVTKDGVPPTLSKQVKGKSTNVLFNLGLSESNKQRNLTDFIKFCKEQLTLTTSPSIKFVSDTEDTTFGYFDYDNKNIVVQLNGRHQMDVMRTVAHELVHYKQDKTLGRELDGRNGSVDENEANSLAGELLRRWGQKNPTLFTETLAEGYKLKLERDKDIDVLHILDTNTKKRIEVRGKKGYEGNGYDAQDKLHQVLDSIGRAANISELMNGEVVTINPKHPQGPNAIKTVDDVLTTEIVVKKPGALLQAFTNPLVEALGELDPSTEIYVDMDGVLADFFGSWARLMDKADWRDIKDVSPALAKIRATDDFWLKLPVLPQARKLLALIKQVKGEYNICTSPLADDPNSEPHKRVWIEKNLGFFPPKNVYITHNKPQYATNKNGKPNILIDDYGVNIDKWEAAGGIGFKYKDHKFERTAQELGQLVKEPVDENFADGRKPGRKGLAERSGINTNRNIRNENI
jgi:5'(3')-deoxyribonucleotidase